MSDCGFGEWGFCLCNLYYLRTFTYNFKNIGALALQNLILRFAIQLLSKSSIFLAFVRLKIPYKRISVYSIPLCY